MAINTFLDWLVVGLRWAHIVAILGWIGSSLYYMWLDSKLRLPSPRRENVLGEAWMGHGGGFYIVEKRSITPGHVPSPVYWFRVEAGVTWITGFLLLVLVYYWTGGLDLVDRETSVMSPRAAIAFAIALLALAWIVYDRLWISRLAEDNVTLTNVISLILLFGVVYMLCKLFTGRAAFIHVGAVIGTNMVANVWTRIIPSQQEAVAATTAGRERNPVLATRARRRAIHNTYMTLPVIFTMIANHAPGTYSNPLNWLILSLLIVVGMAARHLMIMFDRRQPASRGWVTAAAPLAVSIVALGFLSIPRYVTPPSEGHVSFTVVRGILELRCASCHSRTPTVATLASAPNGVTFGTPQEIAARAAMIKASTIQTRAMPPANTTRMTDEERSLIARWLDDGARID